MRACDVASEILVPVPLVLLPGMMCDVRLYTPQLVAFSPWRSVVFSPVSGADSVAELARQILATAPPRFALAGLSMGGIVAMDLVRQAPERVAGLALLDTNPLAEAEKVAARRTGQLARVAAGELKAVMREDMKPHYLTSGPRRNQILDLCLEMALALGPEVFARQSHALRTRPDQTETLRAFRAPAVILCGEDDALCPRSRHELMAELMPQADFHVIPGAGHLPTLEQPDLTTRYLERWLTQIDSQFILGEGTNGYSTCC